MSDLWVPLDVNAPDDPKILEAGDRAELVFYRSLCLAKRRGSDGAIHRAQLRLLGAGDDEVEALVRTGLWARTEDGNFQIVAFLKRNPSRADVEEKRRAEASRKKSWRDKKAAADTSQRDKNGATEVSRVARQDVPSTATDSRVEKSRVENNSSSDVPPVDKYGQVVDNLVRARMNKPGIGNPDAYRDKCRADIDQRHGPKIRQLLAEFPTAPADAIAGHIDGQQSSLRYYKRATV